MTISSVVQSGFFQDDKQLIRIPPRASTELSAARKRSKLAREKAKKRLSNRNRLLWTTEEHERFLQALEMYPSGPWKIIANHVGTRSTRQAMTHAQKYRQKIERRRQKLHKLDVTVDSSLLDMDAIFPCSPVAIDTAEFESVMPQSPAESDVVEEDAERELMMAFLDDFQPLVMDCDEPLAALGDFTDDDPFWLDVGAITASVAAATAQEWVADASL